VNSSKERESPSFSKKKSNSMDDIQEEDEDDANNNNNKMNGRKKKGKKFATRNEEEEEEVEEEEEEYKRIVEPAVNLLATSVPVQIPKQFKEISVARSMTSKEREMVIPLIDFYTSISYFIKYSC
jgi:hypothetical protein